MTCFGLKIWGPGSFEPSSAFWGICVCGIQGSLKVQSTNGGKLQNSSNASGSMFMVVFFKRLSSAPVDAFCSIHLQADEVFLAFSPPTEPYSPNLSKQRGLGEDACLRRSPYSTCTSDVARAKSEDVLFDKPMLCLRRPRVIS